MINYSFGARDAPCSLCPCAFRDRLYRGSFASCPLLHDYFFESWKEIDTSSLSRIVAPSADGKPSYSSIFSRISTIKKLSSVFHSSPLRFLRVARVRKMAELGTRCTIDRFRGPSTVIIYMVSDDTYTNSNTNYIVLSRGSPPSSN